MRDVCFEEVGSDVPVTSPRGEYPFQLAAPCITVEPDGDVFHAAPRADSKGELSMWRAIFCYH